MLDHIPKEVLIKIFLRLPVKQLLRCRCICKTWTNDYKVIRIVYYSTNDDSLMVPPEVEIFELSRGTWRINNSASVPAYDVSKYSSQIVLEGAIHWVGYYSPRELTIAVYVVHDEEFKEFRMPDEISGTALQHLSVMLCCQLLSIIQYKKRGSRLCYESCCIWVMNEYGVHDSWTKLFNVVVTGGIGKVLGLRNNVEVLLVGGQGELISYDPWYQRSKSLGISGESCSFYAGIYMESLVLLKGRKGSISRYVTVQG
ncbi:F-box/kelch-repeat protein At3g06240 [Ricinus communis]|uniref:F-box/kelch-repeat protein At3g06240 n=1 Tax=Ricinus communis TaxID=3988 RepID=UPI000D69DD36|nr:F-box/kelch-repeat protein At3g06240 [Ricinus communis]|eukprot:XP_025014614.1 F-box/kelch-repeat protein At3g06240-like isoform X2 [Ricinus communis]